MISRFNVGHAGDKYTAEVVLDHETHLHGKVRIRPAVHVVDGWLESYGRGMTKLEFEFTTQDATRLTISTPREALLERTEESVALLLETVEGLLKMLNRNDDPGPDVAWWE
jgi:hypothetical protein